MKIVVTGGAGFIGSHIVESLLRLGHTVAVYDNFSSGSMENLRTVRGDIEIIEADILDSAALAKAFRGTELVSHQAAQLEIFKSTDDPYFDLQVNTVGTLNVLAAAKQAGVRKIVNASSACIYGQVDGLTPESHYPRPNWAYGVSKLAAEKYCEIYSDYQSLPVVNLRYGITYGEREWFRRVLTLMCKRVILDAGPVVFGAGAQVRDFVYVGDVVRMNELAMFSGAANGRSYNVATGIGTTINELAEKVIAASGKALQVIHEDTAEGGFSKLIPDKRRNTAELKTMLLDISRARAELGWEPKTGLLEGLQREIAWASANLHRWEKVFYTC